MRVRYTAGCCCNEGVSCTICAGCPATPITNTVGAWNIVNSSHPSAGDEDFTGRGHVEGTFKINASSGFVEVAFSVSTSGTNVVAWDSFRFSRTSNNPNGITVQLNASLLTLDTKLVTFPSIPNAATYGFCIDFYDDTVVLVLYPSGVPGSQVFVFDYVALRPSESLTINDGGKVGYRVNVSTSFPNLTSTCIISLFTRSFTEGLLDFAGENACPACSGAKCVTCCPDVDVPITWVATLSGFSENPDQGLGFGDWQGWKGCELLNGRHYLTFNSTCNYSADIGLDVYNEPASTNCFYTPVRCKASLQWIPFTIGVPGVTYCKLKLAFYLALNTTDDTNCECQGLFAEYEKIDLPGTMCSGSHVLTRTQLGDCEHCTGVWPSTLTVTALN